MVCLEGWEVFTGLFITVLQEVVAPLGLVALAEAAAVFQGAVLLVAGKLNKRAATHLIAYWASSLIAGAMASLWDGIQSSSRFSSGTTFK